MRRDRWEEIQRALNSNDGLPFNAIDALRDAMAEVPVPPVEPEVLAGSDESHRYIIKDGKCLYQYRGSLAAGQWKDSLGAVACDVIDNLRAELAEAKAKLEAFTPQPTLSHRFTDADYERLFADADALIESEPDGRKQGTFSLVVNILRELRADLLGKDRDNALMEDALKGRVVVDGVEWQLGPEGEVWYRNWPSEDNSLRVILTVNDEWACDWEAKEPCQTHPTLFAAMRVAVAAHPEIAGDAK